MRRVTLLTNPDVCNLNCPLCFLKQRGIRYAEISGIGGEMDFSVAENAIKKYAGEFDERGQRILREVIPSTMGEPLLYSHFDKLLDLCRGLCLPINLTTNGTFPGKWGEAAGMECLLRACSDIKISSLASECFSGWKRNVEKLLEVRRNMANHFLPDESCWLSTVSIQATLHQKNLMMIPELIAWATAIGVDRIKWNSVVFLNCASSGLRAEYGLNRSAGELHRYILDCCKMCESEVHNEGSLFTMTASKAASDCVTTAFSSGSVVPAVLSDGVAPSVSSDGVARECAADDCPFADEVWILPDGSEERCPHPERRFGNGMSPEAERCFVLGKKCSRT